MAGFVKQTPKPAELPSLKAAGLLLSPLISLLGRKVTEIA
jgi:hypothetical protein